MPRYVALLRGVSPLNAKMPELKQAFEAAGFTAVKTVLGSGNVVFDARAASEASLERKCEKAMDAALGRHFATIVRSTEYLQQLVDADPFAAFRLPDGAKCVVTFLRDPPGGNPKLPIARDGATILAVRGREVLTAYERSDKGPVFMVLLEKAFGKDVTTRTLDTVRKCAAA
ncbi:MAG TPA: DUF1697 domain-containing protein [Xanthomonadales bacterium]|nr:DUF1697 domain-containing protein [Xanthomonadales bacterium]